MKDYLDHSTKVTLPEFAKNIWTNLSDFWQNYTDTDLITSTWAAWQKIMDAVFSTVGARNSDVTIFSDVYSFGYNHVPIELTFDTSSEHGYVIQGYDFRHILQLQDYINNPEIVLIEGIDYTYTTDLRIGQRAYIDTTSELDSMWVFYIQEKTIEELIARFGVFVDYSYIRHEEGQTKKDILALMKAQEFGSIIQHMECALCVENDFPFTLYGGTVVAIDSTDSITIAATDDSIETITNTTGLPFRQRLTDGTWSTLSVGDFIIGPSQVVEAVTINDIVLDPNFYKKIPIGTVEAYHTFVVKFNPNLPDPTVEYYIDMDASLTRINKLKKITSKPYLTIMFDFAVDASTAATSYVDLDSLSAYLAATSWTNLLVDMEAYIPATSFGFDLNPLECLLTTSYSGYIIPLGVMDLFTSYTGLEPLPAFVGGTSYGGT